MNLQSIVITNCIGIALTLLVLYSSHLARKSKETDSRLLTGMLLILASCCLMEMISFLVDGVDTTFAWIMAWVSNTWIYLGNPTIATLWLLFTDYHLHRKVERLKTVYRPHLIILAASWIVILGNLVWHYLFSIDENNVYTRKTGAYIFFILSILIVVNSIVEVIRYRRCHTIEIFFPIWTFLTPFFIGVILQMLIYGVSLGWCSTAIGIAAVYMSMQNELAYRDVLTGLYNRHYLTLTLDSWENRSGIMIDMDYFKEINDRFGHSQGDEALKDMAVIWRECAPENGITIRFAGDEFILLLPTNLEKIVRETEGKIRDAVDEFNRVSGRPYHISISMGHAIYSHKTPDEFMEAIDRAMYLEKQQRHANGEMVERRHADRGTVSKGKES